MSPGLGTVPREFRGFEYELGLMEKQVRMLSEIADNAPVEQPQGRFVVVSHDHLKDIVELLKLEIEVLRYGLQQKFGASETSPERAEHK